MRWFIHTHGWMLLNIATKKFLCVRDKERGQKIKHKIKRCMQNLYICEHGLYYQLSTLMTDVHSKLTVSLLSVVSCCISEVRRMDSVRTPPLYWLHQLALLSSTGTISPPSLPHSAAGDWAHHTPTVLWMLSSIDSIDNLPYTYLPCTFYFYIF